VKGQRLKTAVALRKAYNQVWWFLMTKLPGSVSFAAAVLALASSASLFAQDVSGPFGLHRGMTLEQVIQIVGKGAVKETKRDDAVQLSTVPKPHSAFEFYVLIFSPKDGLLKIGAIGHDINTNGFGEAVHDSFVEIRDAISQTYGQPEHNFDFLQSGSIWKEPEDWMMGLLKEERTLAANWRTALPNRINLILLEAKASSTEKGYLSLGYEFDGWHEYADAIKKKAATVF
jgi:hypothetical protein